MGSRKNASPRSLRWLEGPRITSLVHPSLLELPTLDRLRAKMLAVLGILLTTVGPLVASGYFRKGELAYGAAFILCTLLGLGTFLAIRLVGSTRLSSHLGSFALWTASVTGTYALGGTSSIAARWFAVIPVLAAVLGGGRLAAPWFVISWLTFVGLTFAPSLGVTFPEPSAVSDDRIHQVVTMTTFMVIVISLFAVSEMLRVWLVREREETQEKLEDALHGAVAAGQAKDRFMAMMGHELRTPLNAIIGYAELLVEEMEADGDEAYIDDAESIRSAGRHLLALISDILATTMFDSGRLELRPDTCDLVELVEGLEPTIRTVIRERDNRYIVSIDPALVGTTLYTDPSKLRQILFNLLGNAAKFTEEGKISLRVRPVEGDRICFEIADTGIGMDHEAQKHVWGEFVQVDDSSTRKHGGIGLGLALVKRLTTMLTGKVTLESEPGRGSTFRVVLPRELDPNVETLMASLSTASLPAAKR